MKVKQNKNMKNLIQKEKMRKIFQKIVDIIQKIR